MASFVAAGYGIDDITLGFDMEGSGSIKRLNTLPGSQTRRGKMLGEVVSWGKWAHLLGCSVAFWKGGYETAVRSGESGCRGRAVRSFRARRRRVCANRAHGGGRPCQLREALGYATRRS